MNTVQTFLNTEVASCLRRSFYPEWRVKIEGESNVPTNGPAILAPIHTSRHDGYLLLAHSQRPLSIVKRYDQRHNVPHHLIEQLRMIAACAVGSIIIDRSIYEPDETKALLRTGMRAPTLSQFLDKAQSVLGDGQLLCIFPQGERRPRGTIGELARGTARLALASQSPIIPTDICYSGHRASITYGEPLEPNGTTRTMTALLRDRLEDFTRANP